MKIFTTLIAPEQLAGLQNSAPDKLIICDCRFDLADAEAGQRAFLEAHIPGAAWLSLESDLSGPKTGHNGRHPLPHRAALAQTMAKLGATQASQIVAYDAADSMFAARLWWLLRWLGHENIAVLDGGLAAWRQAGYELAHGPYAAQPPGDFAPCTPLVQIVDYAQLRAAPMFIIDARAPDRFAGLNETLDMKSGHIPGARNRWFKQNVEASGRFKPAEALREEFATLLDGVPVETVVSSCGSGVTACQTLLAMSVAGLPGGQLYPGSWSEWSAQPDAPMATGADD